MKYLIYARVSPRGSDFEGETSIAMQLEICRRYVKEHGGTVVDERFDEFFSGKDTKRPEFQRVMDELDSGRGEWDTLIVYKLSRMTRSLKDGANIFDKLFQQGRGFVSATENLDFSSPAGRAMLGMMQVFNQFEREQSAENTRNKMMQIAARGEWPSGNPPFGYRRGEKKDNKLYVDERNAAIVRDVFEMYASVHERTRTIISKYRGIVSQNRLFVMLRNQTYLGKIVYNGKIFPGKHPAIISQELFDRVQKVLPDPVIYNRPKAQQYKYLLSGIIYCECGNHMVGQSAKSGDYNYYTCRDKEHCKRRVSARLVDKAVLDYLNSMKIPQNKIDRAVEQLQKEAELEREKDQPEINQLRRSIVECEKEKESLIDAIMVAGKTLDEDLISRINIKSGKITAEIERLKERLDKLLNKGTTDTDYRTIALDMLKKLKALKDLNETDPITIRQAILANIYRVVYTFDKDFKIYPISSNEKEWCPGRGSNPRPTA